MILMHPRQRRSGPITLALVCLGVVACKSAPPAPVTAITVPVAVVGRADLANDLTVTAEFTPYQSVDVMAKVAGFVKAINVDIGDHVQAGQVLATLDVPELQDETAKTRAALLAAAANIATAKSNIAHAQAGANMAHLSYTRIAGVAKSEPGLVPRQEIDLAQARDLEAAAALASAQSGLQAAEQGDAQAIAERDRASAMLRYATIRAPFAGVVTHRYANTGSMIQAGTASQTQAMPLVQLAEDRTLRLLLPVPVTAVAGIHAGQPVDIVVNSLGTTLKGTVTRFAEDVQMATRTMTTEVDVPNKDGKLLPGMYAEVHLHLADRPNALSAPLDAVDGLGSASQHVDIVRDGHVHIVAVTTGLQTPDRVEILSGLREGDQLVVGRRTGLAEDQAVDPRIAAYDAPAKK
ncbi:RND family efflux transporter, MFP subunit [Granulicella rosea]|uniref:RND family efflux transporter, MFP subunit n=2 Tax=Granulicella rosea TaxID=474952 RepID=A0A239M3M3_9BACT|nr:RND family efflux transporter, MFP subunit [Granulicella rosea]